MWEGVPSSANQGRTFLSQENVAIWVLIKLIGSWVYGHRVHALWVIGSMVSGPTGDRRIVPRRGRSPEALTLGTQTLGTQSPKRGPPARGADARDTKPEKRTLGTQSLEGSL